jgi:hypothetical protein
MPVATCPVAGGGEHGQRPGVGAGVDVRTVAGRLGHGGGGATTLRVYAAWLTAADKTAAGLLATRLPKPPQFWV